jgi:hypothetical protein
LLQQCFHHGNDVVDDDEGAHQQVDVTAAATLTTAVISTQTPHMANTQDTTITPPTCSTQTSPSHDALTDSLGESQGNKAKDIEELQLKYANMLPQAEEQKIALEKLQKKYDDLLLHFQTYLAKMQDPKSLITRTLNLPFKNARDFDGSDAVNKYVIVKRKKTQIF